jgi:hypothetical protein
MISPLPPVRVGDSVHFDAALTTPPDPHAVLRWDIHEQGVHVRNGRLTDHTYSVPGEHWVVLVVRSTFDGTADTAATRVEVHPA